MGLLKKVFKTVKKVAFAATPLALVKKSPAKVAGVAGALTFKVANRASPKTPASKPATTPVAPATTEDEALKKPAANRSILI